MSTLRNLLTRGNSKRAEAIHAFRLPAVLTCPGRILLYESHCYAINGGFRADRLKDMMAENLVPGRTWIASWGK